MKIGIVTFQLAWNCGAVLQCYALQSYLENQGHEVIVINYRPKYKKYRYKKYCNPFKCAVKEYKKGESLPLNIKRTAKKFVRSILNYRSDSEHIRQYDGFNAFCSKYLHLSRVYESIEELQKDPPDCDVYISGSDQLWNPKLTNDKLDRAYFLDFGGQNVKKITYAISACELNIDKYGKELKGLFAGLSGISLREKVTKDVFEKLYSGKIGICPDPTFLPEKNTYDVFRPKNPLPIQDYILVYLLSDATDDVSAVKKVRSLKECLNKPVLVISGSRHWDFEVTQIRGVIPEEFVYYIRNANCVVCNSFHATVFSILFEKKFVTMSFKNRNSRMQELLVNLGLEDRMLEKSGDIYAVMNSKIDYNLVNHKIEVLKNNGKQYLRDNL